MMNTYHATRQGEIPGITFTAATPTAAKARATRELEDGAFLGQTIILVEAIETSNGEMVRSDRVWKKKAGYAGGWTAYGDAI